MNQYPGTTQLWADPRYPDGACDTGGSLTHAMRSPVKPATRWMRVASRSSGRVVAGMMVMGQHAPVTFSLRPVDV